MRAIGTLIDVNDTKLVLSNEEEDIVINHNFENYDEMKLLIGKQLDIEFILDDLGDKIAAEKRLALFTMDISSNLEPTSLVIDYSKTNFETLSLEPYKLTEITTTEKALCVGQTIVNTARASMVKFKLKCKDGKTIEAALFNSTPEAVPSFVGRVVFVNIYKNGEYFNIDEINASDVDELANPLEELCTEFIKEKTRYLNAINKQNKINDTRIMELLLSIGPEQVITLANQINTVLIINKLSDIDVNICIQGLLYNSIVYEECTFKDIDVRELSDNDRRICRAIQTSSFSTKLQALVSDGEYKTKESSVIRLALGMSDELYKLDNVYDSKRIKR